MSLLEIKELSLHRGSRLLIKPFSYSFNSGAIYALVGNNGAGKSTLLHTLCGLLPVGKRTIFLDGMDLSHMKSNKRAEAITFLMQQLPEQPYCVVRSRIFHGLIPSTGFVHFETRAESHKIEAIASELQISHLLDRPFSMMSGGEQRLVNLAKCFVNPLTKVLLLDEPSVFLDFAQQSNVARNFRRQKDQGKTIIFSSHDAGFIKRMADVIVSIEKQEFKEITTAELNDDL